MVYVDPPHVVTHTRFYLLRCLPYRIHLCGCITLRLLRLGHILRHCRFTRFAYGLHYILFCYTLRLSLRSAVGPFLVTCPTPTPTHQCTLRSGNTHLPTLRYVWIVVSTGPHCPFPFWLDDVRHICYAHFTHGSVCGLVCGLQFPRLFLQFTFDPGLHY